MTDAKKEAWEIVENIERIRGAGAQLPGAIIRTTPLIDRAEITRGDSLTSSESALGQVNDAYRNMGKPILGSLPISFKKGVGQGDISLAGQKYTVPPPANVETATPTIKDHLLLEKHKGDYYAALLDPSVLNDAQFRDFVDKHGDQVPGIGYVDVLDAKGKPTGKTIRVAEKPQPQENLIPNPQPQETLTIDQYNAQTQRLLAMGRYGAGAGAAEDRKAAVNDRKVAEENRKIDRQDRLKFEKQKNWENRYGTVNPETQKVELNVPLAVAKSVVEGRAVPDPSLQGMEEQTEQAYKEHAVKWNAGFNKQFPKSAMTAAQRKIVRDRDFLNIFNPPQAK